MSGQPADRPGHSETSRERQREDPGPETDSRRNSQKRTIERAHWSTYCGHLSALPEMRAGSPSTTGSAPEVEGDSAPQGEAGSTPIEDRDLRVELEIERGGPCVMDSIDGNIVGVDVWLSDEECRVDVDIQENSDGNKASTKQFTSPVCEYCPGAIFPKYGCIPRYLDVETGAFAIETYLSGTDAVSSLVNDLRDRCERVKIRSLTSTEQHEYTQNCTIDLSPLTPKQREAVHTAQTMGYYEPCSKVQLGEVAAELGLSSSALSQRLQRAEANVLQQVSCECERREDSG